MLELNDPLWDKIGEHVPTMLSRLAASWDDETARSLLFEDLCHQEGCYGATYAAIPHLLKIAEPEANWRQRREITYFLGHVALCARGQDPYVPLSGLPETLKGWSGFWTNGTGEPVNAADLQKILSIKASFFSALPAISALCERTLLENEDAEAAPYLLSGIAAADGLPSIARLLHDGDEGWFTCSSCGWGYKFTLFGERIAAYADTPPGAPDDKKSLSDFKDGAPSRADGFMTPITEDGILDTRITALLSAAERAARPDLALRVRHFAGTFRCCKCGVQGPMQAR
jgi:hypothetical protein